MNCFQNKLSKSIKNSQQSLNKNLVDRQKESRINFNNQSFLTNSEANSPKKKVKFGKQDDSERSQYRLILENQINLRQFSQNNALQTSRLLQLDNLNKGIEHYQYGKESVDVKEQILKRFHQDYSHNSNMIQKFKAQAEQKRKTRYKNKFIKAKQPSIKRADKSQDNFNKTLMDLELKRIQRQKIKRKIDKQNVMNIGNMLRNISYQLHKNSQILEKGISEIKDVIPRTKKDAIKIANFKYADTLDFQMQRLSQKIPIVIYNNRITDARVYYNNLNENIKLVNRSELSSQDTHKILKGNSQRLKYLVSYSQY